MKCTAMYCSVSWACLDSRIVRQGYKTDYNASGYPQNYYEDCVAKASTLIP